MKILKKATFKDDGRVLIYYHFPKTASASQKQAFDDVACDESEVEIGEITAELSREHRTDDARV